MMLSLLNFGESGLIYNVIFLLTWYFYVGGNIEKTFLMMKNVSFKALQYCFHLIYFNNNAFILIVPDLSPKSIAAIREIIVNKNINLFIKFLISVNYSYLNWKKLD